MFYKECVPFAPTLIESMRSMGYSFSSAIADIIDNSVSAGAKNIKIMATPGSESELIIFDDGCGMNEQELYEAMRYGSTNPTEEREANDLGRFGLGLKSASMSQCRNLIVVSKKDGELHAFSWNLDYVIQSGSWSVRGFSTSEIQKLPYINMFDKVKSGTYVYLSEFDRIKRTTNDMETLFFKKIDEMKNHISLVFHRFLEDGLQITINNVEVTPKDPFLKTHKATQVKRESSFRIDDAEITLQPYVLPFANKLSPEDLAKIGGKSKIKKNQGFYVYRNKRLIIWGTWFNLNRVHELNKYARIQVDIPNSLDDIWEIDIKKSRATLPDSIKKNMFYAVVESVRSSENIIKYRGRKDNVSKDVEFTWNRIKLRNDEGYRYEINRDIPELAALRECLDDKTYGLLKNAIKTIEENFPIEAVYSDVAQGNINQQVGTTELEIEEKWSDILELLEDIDDDKKIKYCDKYLKFNMYRKYPEIISRLKEMKRKYECDTKKII
ncbi:Histidine kinase-, DNA gyrase B-, and HSP90-like ATPase [Granulicatella balaenopterae]|uniref:Histidine kinase-, DNA gyrase B-, and HSP90-like ATPase n=1 Tax=Granulicatella balaenopterae TaxID=137733 RepID=A0A1H9N6J3_9LACT|nr:ATP-binding protein [Granulicatella balaenopterae]SER31387.1 Histidine kinase-, DNA gyrase B-, and HSP90-like ATPase [Granulicatella balaenopterae]